MTEINKKNETLNSIMLASLKVGIFIFENSAKMFLKKANIQTKKQTNQNNLLI